MRQPSPVPDLRQYRRPWEGEMPAGGLEIGFPARAKPSASACIAYDVVNGELRESILLAKHSLPDVAGFWGHHWLSNLAAECFAELRHVLDSPIHAEPARRMLIGVYLQAFLFGP